MSKYEEKESFSDSVIGKILGTIISIFVLCFLYIGWVNSGSNDGIFFGFAIQLPFESKSHYCWRKSNMVFTYDESIMNRCLAE